MERFGYAPIGAEESIPGTPGASEIKASDTKDR
jgi:hypothetical protein